MAATSYPPGGTWFDNMKRSFADVPIENDAIKTTEFLEASESLVALFDLLGSVAFTPVKNDLSGNIKKIRDRQLAAPADSETLQALCINELKTGKHTATEGLLWLSRGLDFTAQGLSHNLANPKSELSDSFRNSYGNTLKPYHSFMVKPVFSAAMSATPYRSSFYSKLGSDPEKVQSCLEREMQALDKVVGILKVFLASKDAQWK